MSGPGPTRRHPRSARTAHGAPARSRSWRAGFLLLGILAGIGAVFLGLGYVVNPWAHQLPGRPALVGYWAGTMTLAGDEREIVVRLNQSGGRGSPGLNLAGKAHMCDTEGAGRGDYVVRGRTLNFRGTRFSIGLTSGSDEQGTQVGGIDGTWDGADLLRLRAHPYTIGPDGKGRSRTSADANKGSVDDQGNTIRFDLRRSTENAFNTTC
jgi:hypothetical protein